MQTTEELLMERHKSHGSFIDHAYYTQAIKQIIRQADHDRDQRGQPTLTNVQLEALEMIAHKIGRILAGDATFQDHYDDIAGYAKLVPMFTTKPVVDMTAIDEVNFNHTELDSNGPTNS